ncbi:hypothetical protein M441DRAFT_141907, partial [Trichoderma asperellum CBS 433.97]
FSLAAPLKDYKVFIPQWEVEVSPGGSMVILNGTIEQVHDELIKLNPNWDNEYLGENPSKHSENSTRLLDKRTDFSGAQYFCRGRWPEALKEEIKRGIKYLRRVNGRPTNGAGPGNCGRVSCSYHSAIWWCNDDHQPKTLESFGSIADGAQYIVDHCGRYYLVSGQVFHKTNWNVIVREDTDSC